MEKSYLKAKYMKEFDRKGHGSFTILDVVLMAFGLLLTAPIIFPMVVSELIFGPDSFYSKLIGYPLNIVWVLFLVYFIGKYLWKTVSSMIEKLRK